MLGSFAVAGLLLVLWLVGLLTGHTAGGLIHLLMLFAPVVVAAGVAVGVVLIVMESKQPPGR
ncbi:MAG: lmo0937 family membrane protein [Acidobacteriota bacterium]|nr:lmo0937 family membrane protein [Acidobacteriota bacterium]